MKKKITLGVLAVLAIAQFFRIDKSAPAHDKQGDFMNMHKMPASVSASLKAACYDCHSYETQYPWYTNITPVGQWVKGHIKAGRQNMNFSTWAEYPADKRAHKLEECVDEIQDGKMPPTSYGLMHSAARLSDEQKQELTQWLASQK